MGVLLNIVKPPGRDYFVSGDTVSGGIELHSVRTSTISSIVISLKGKLNIAFRQSPNCHDSSFRESKHVLFSQQKVFSFASGTPIELQNSTAEPFRPVFSFALEFPALITDGIDHAQNHNLSLSSLPPSLSIVCDGVKISVSYTLQVVVNRIGVFNRNNTARCSIAFRPLGGSSICSEHHMALLKTVSYLSTTTLGIKGPTPQEHSDLPAYTPSVQFEVEIPPCKTIFPGDHIHLGLAFVIPDELRHLFLSIWILRITIRLKITTTGLINNQKRGCIEYATCYSSVLSLPLHLPKLSSRLVIPPELWHHSTYPHLLPSFQSNGVQRTHQLEILAEFAWASKNNTSTAVSRNDVVVESDADLASEDPPSYD